MLQWVRSLIYIVQVYLVMGILGIVFAPWAILSPKGARAACKTFCHWAFWTARWMIGLRGEVRGPIPQDEVLIAAKHQSFFDILLLFEALPTAKFIMKRELLWTPVIGVYAKRLGCVPVDRGKRGMAIDKMVRDVEAGRAEPGQLVIYPQGTRVAPGDKKPYKIGTAILYEQLGQRCVPTATNVGLFWPRKGILRKPGLAVVEFLPAIEPGMERGAFMATLEREIESSTDALMQEAGFNAQD
ncbi:1-acyl-sn-glycerol-3-phosphate acyltransferase [Aliishimia ponticola]|uniref:1-acyl-sn-glycerol-3-phosphate acyltransferase n=1 Tax=Aliishimia ponticola TaxID=2499833 RepID=A0A4V3XK89_9RHOB|nr:1-acyl-sn-glycerol-3-phosphate acyltransferase [Aliishimia ponticola]